MGVILFKTQFIFLITEVLEMPLEVGEEDDGDEDAHEDVGEDGNGNVQGPGNRCWH